MTRCMQKGETVDYRPSVNVDAGDVVALDGAQGVALGVTLSYIGVGTRGTLAVAGVFDVPKASGEIAAGTPLYWDDSNRQAYVAQYGKQYLGRAVAHAAEDDEVVRVLLNAPLVEV